MSTVLLLGTGLFWTLAYVFIIRQSFVDRTYGMPLVALCANLSWEFIFSVVRPPTSAVAHTVDVVWLCFDLVIAYAAVRFGPREFPGLPRPVFYFGFAGTLVLAYAGTDLFSRQFDGGHGTLAAFASNLMMSGLFLGMLIGRRDLRGQSPWIAATKLIGTLFASLYTWHSGDYAHSILMLYLYAGNAVLDLAYLAAVLAVRRVPTTPRPGAAAAEVASTADRRQVPG